jgi:hypothetical protein
MPKPTTLQGLVTTRNLRALAVQLVLLAAIAGVLVVYHREIYSRVFGPFRVTVDEVGAIASLDSEFRRYFMLDEGRLIPLPLRDVTVRTRRGRETGRSYMYYFALPGQQRIVLARAAEEAPSLPIVGTLQPVPAEMERRMLEFYPELRSGPGLAPLLLEAEDSLGSWASLYTAGALTAPVIALIFLSITLGRLWNFRRSRSVVALGRFKVPVDQLVAAIDDELAREDPTTAVRSILLTTSWLVHVQPFKLEVVHLDELVWVHAAITRRYMYYFIPVGSTNYLRLGDRSGRLRTIQGREKAIPHAIVAIAQRIPWVFAGHSDELEQAYRRNRAAVVAAVDQRRQQMLGGSAQPAG